MTRVLVVAGYGMVGHRLVERIRALDTHRAWRIVVAAEERHPAYDRVRLSSYLDGGSRSDLTLAGADLRDDPRVDLRLGCPIRSLDPAARTARTAGGDLIRYDALVLATGSRPFVPPLPGRDLTGCFVYRTFDDLDALRAAARPGRPGVVIGGGLLGLEAANALRLLGMRVHVVEAGPHLMAAQLDEGAARVLLRHVTEHGLRVHCPAAPASIDADADGAVRAVTLADGAVLDTDVVVFATGIRPRDELAHLAGLDRGERGGIAVDDLCRTADPRIWAVGECAAVNGRCHGLLAPGHRMADSVARQLTGQSAEPFDGSDTSASLKLLGVQMATFGASRPRSGEVVEAVFAEGADRYAKLFLSRDGGVLTGGILAGATGSWTSLRRFVGRQPPADLEQLLLP